MPTQAFPIPDTVNGMARARTKGEPISIRLNQHHDELLRLGAEQANMPAAAFAQLLLEGVLDPPKPKRTGRPAGTPVVARAGAHDLTCKCLICKPPKEKA